MRRYALRDDQWDRIKDFLPGREGHVGGTAADNRLFVEAVLYRNRAGIPWRDLPERFGDWKIVHQRFSRWAKSGVFERHVPGEITMITAPVAGLLTGAALDWREGRAGSVLHHRNGIRFRGRYTTPSLKVCRGPDPSRERDRAVGRRAVSAGPRLFDVRSVTAHYGDGAIFGEFSTDPAHAGN